MVHNSLILWVLMASIVYTVPQATTSENALSTILWVIVLAFIFQKAVVITTVGQSRVAAGFQPAISRVESQAGWKACL